MQFVRRANRNLKKFQRKMYQLRKTNRKSWDGLSEVWGRMYTCDNDLNEIRNEVNICNVTGQVRSSSLGLAIKKMTR